MHKLTRMRYSRDQWKNKARERAEQIREYRKAMTRWNEKKIELEERIKQLESRAEKKI